MLNRIVLAVLGKRPLRVRNTVALPRTEAYRIAHKAAIGSQHDGKRRPLRITTGAIEVG